MTHSFNLAHIKPSFKVFISLFLVLYLNGMPSFLNAAPENYDYLLRSYPETEKTQLKRAINLTTQKYPGKVIGINQQTDNEDQYFKVKLLNTKGQLKTYYVNKSLNKISP